HPERMKTFSASTCESPARAGMLAGAFVGVNKNPTAIGPLVERAATLPRVHRLISFVGQNTPGCARAACQVSRMASVITSELDLKPAARTARWRASREASIWAAALRFAA